MPITDQELDAMTLTQLRVKSKELCLKVKQSARRLRECKCDSYIGNRIIDLNATSEELEQINRAMQRKLAQNKGK